MRITIAAVGRAKAGPLRDLYDDYTGRVSEQTLGKLSLTEVEERRPLPPAALMRREAELLLAAVPADARLIALDGRGKALGSEAFASLLRDWRDDGLQDLVIAIGGAEGLDSAVRQRADLLLSLGPMIWPHLLVRVMVAEQLFRAQSILSGHPYHRG